MISASSIAPESYFETPFGVAETLLREVMQVALAKGGDHCELFFQHTRTTYVGLEDKAVNRAYEQAFVDNVEFHGARVGQVVVEDHMAAIEWEFDITPKGGERMVQKQVSMQTWQGDQIVREAFYYA